MKKSLMAVIIGVTSLAISGCLKSDSDSSGSSSSIPSISVTCTSGLDSVCDTGGNGNETYVGWATQSCAEFTGSVIAFISGAATCSGGSCSFTGSTGWLDDYDNPVSSIPGASTAIAWLNFVDNGGGPSDDGPQTGDIFCCKDSALSNGALTDSDCQVMP